MDIRRKYNKGIDSALLLKNHLFDGDSEETQYIAYGPSIVVSSQKPLTDFEERDKNNAFRLGLIKENTDLAYREWQDKFHKANERDKAIGLAGANTAMGLASLFTMANPASMYAYEAMGMANLPSSVENLKLDIKNKQYVKAGVDALHKAGSKMLGISVPLGVGAYTVSQEGLQKEPLESYLSGGTLDHKVGDVVNGDINKMYELIRKGYKIQRI